MRDWERLLNAYLQRAQRTLHFDVFGRRVAIERTGSGWQAYDVGNEGKRRPADFAIPHFVQEAELAQFLADLFHESASSAHPEVKPL
ncbi:MAG TPA: hypothetical protein PLO41_13450 [Rubrivivax sp.]|nr:hypothetical protein [Rubrivivax sp.]